MELDRLDLAISVYKIVHAITINGKEAINLKKSRGFEWRKGKGEMLN